MLRVSTKCVSAVLAVPPALLTNTLTNIPCNTSTTSTFLFTSIRNNSTSSTNSSCNSSRSPQQSPPQMSHALAKKLREVEGDQHTGKSSGGGTLSSEKKNATVPFQVQLQTAAAVVVVLAGAVYILYEWRSREARVEAILLEMEAKLDAAAAAKKQPLQTNEKK